MSMNVYSLRQLRKEVAEAAFAVIEMIVQQALRQPMINAVVFNAMLTINAYQDLNVFSRSVKMIRMMSHQVHLNASI